MIRPSAIAARNPEQFQFLFGFFRIRHQLLGSFGIGGRRKATHPGELIQIAQSEIQRLSAAHRQTGNGAVFAVGQRRVFFFDEGNKIGEQVFLEGGKGLDFVLIEDITHGPVVFHGPAIGHHHDHRFQFSFGVQIVQNHLRIAAFQPFFFIAPNAVQKVQHRIFGFFVDSPAACTPTLCGWYPPFSMDS